MDINDLELSGEILYKEEVYQIKSINYRTESISLRNLNTDDVISVSFDDIEEYGEEV